MIAGWVKIAGLIILIRLSLAAMYVSRKVALLLTGNHDYTISSMPYRNAPIKIEDGAWVGAKTTVCPGVNVHRNAILTVGSVATKDMEKNGIYQGNPALKIRERKIKE